MAATSTVTSTPGALELIGRVEVEQTPAVLQPTVIPGGVTWVTNPPWIEVGWAIALDVAGAGLWVVESTKMGKGESAVDVTSLEVFLGDRLVYVKWP